MNKDFMQYVYKRCELALEENAAYMEMEHNKNEDQEKILAKAEELCYLKGMNDGLKLMMQIVSEQ